MKTFGIRIPTLRAFLIAAAALGIFPGAAFASILDGMEPVVSVGHWHGYNFGEGDKEICAAATLAENGKAKEAGSRFIVFIDFRLRILTTLDEAKVLRDGDANLFVYSSQIDEKSLWSSKRFRFISSGAAGFSSTDFDELRGYLLDSESGEIKQGSSSVSFYSEGLAEVYEFLKKQCGT